MAVYFLWHFPSMRFTRTAPDRYQPGHPALWSPDFPLLRPERRSSDRAPLQLGTKGTRLAAPVQEATAIRTGRHCSAALGVLNKVRRDFHVATTA